jgi:hypothetical protein
MRNTPLTAKKLNTLVAVAHLEEIAEQLGPDWQKPICDIIDILQPMPTPPPDAAVREAVEFSAEVRCGRLARGILHIGKRLRAMRADMASQTDALIAAMHAINDAGILMPDGVLDYASGVRAVQAPRLTGEQASVLCLLVNMVRTFGDKITVSERIDAMDRARAAFPEAFAG